MSYVFSFTFFHCRSFSPCIGAASISHFVTAATKFSCCSSNKKLSPLFFSSLTLDLCRRFFRQRVFVFIDSLVVSALQDAGGYAISRQNNLELHLGCHTY